jgi:hypothetical protein
MPTLTKSQNLTILGSGYLAPVPNGHTLAGFSIGALCLATMTTLYLKHYTKPKLFPPKGFLFPANLG